MRKDDYKLLVNECCNRLPYGVWVDLNGIRGKLNEIKIHHFFYDTNSVQDIKAYTDFFQDNEPIEICNFKLCLRPMSSMTEEEKEYIKCRWCYDDWTDICDFLNNYKIDAEDSYDFTNWLNVHHFDYRDLIEKGLAIDSTDLGIYDLEE